MLVLGGVGAVFFFKQLSGFGPPFFFFFLLLFSSSAIPACFFNVLIFSFSHVLIPRPFCMVSACLRLAFEGDSNVGALPCK